MLILTRRIGETVRIGEDVSVTVLGVKGHQVRIGISAPASVAVHREEIFQKIAEERRAPADTPEAVAPAPKVVRVESKRLRRPTGT